MEDDDVESDLPDVTGIDLADLDLLPETALAAALRRVRCGIHQEADYFAAFQNSL